MDIFKGISMFNIVANLKIQNNSKRKTCSSITPYKRNRYNKNCPHVSPNNLKRNEVNKRRCRAELSERLCVYLDLRIMEISKMHVVLNLK